MSNLGPQFEGVPLYHGTAWPLQDHDFLSADDKPTTNFDLSSKNHVYVTTDPAVARAYAVSMRDKINAAEPGFGAKASVHPFTPYSDLEWDDNEAIDFPETKTDPSKRKWFKTYAGETGPMDERWSDK